MITQIFNQGEHEIAVEIAESLTDAKENNFKEGQYSRYYIDGKLTNNYMAMIRFIVDQTKKNKNNIIPSNKDLMKQRDEMFERQKESIRKQFDKMKEQYKEMNASEETLKKIDEFKNKVNEINVRVKK